ncbi:transposase [Hymenobacter artigasi]|uniref:REP element-mobilizing transposase RayT n=1 Tax=Hymenobacter artigasi TaxID=2719616 RepID=A0ABX1HNF1_9BACT|nr:transposase [Hymenobacter artigasi]NKI90632.1 REP element-mobilizing transposase RayT [Hymenobacter artigasi]
MKPDSERRSIRYEGYDYSMAGYYALTICARNKTHLFGSLVSGETLQPTILGRIVADELTNITVRFPTVRVDTSVVMPNHLHLILVLTRNHAVVLGEVISDFKSGCYTKWRHQLLAIDQPAPPSCWQRNYYDRIIRNAAELEGYRKYILDNPSRW